MIRRQKWNVFFAIAALGAIIAYHNGWIDGMPCAILVMAGLALIANPGPPADR